VRILAFGVLNNPRGAFTINRNARAFLHPPGIDMASEKGGGGDSSSLADAKSRSHYQHERLTRPLPALSHAAYPFYTEGGGDKRWLTSETGEEEGREWVGGLMSVYRSTLTSSRLLTRY